MMLRSLKVKWSLTLVLTSLVGIVLIGVLASQINATEYKRFRNAEMELAVVETVADYYAEFETWVGLDEQVFNRTIRNIRPPERRGIAPFAIADTQGVIVKPSEVFREGMFASPDDIQNGNPIFVDDTLVGTLIISSPPGFDEAELRYLQRTNSILLVGAVVAVAVAVLFGVWLSRQFLRPLAELTDAIDHVKQGKFDQRVPVRTQDELGDLAQAFNQMGEELQRVNKLRRQMTADIAHDLRTPLTVISGYLEGLRDGSLQPTQARFDTLFQESQLLKRLIDDLRMLSLADAGELNLVYTSVHPSDLLEQVYAAFTPLAESEQVTLEIETNDTLPKIKIDRDRMAQVLGNLISNSLRFTPAAGNITLSANATNQQVILTVKDTGSGIDPQHLQNIFARFYRVNESRHQAHYESGLGLAIAKSIVMAHGGTINADSQLGQGTTITIMIPYRH